MLSLQFSRGCRWGDALLSKKAMYVVAHTLCVCVVWYVNALLRPVLRETPWQIWTQIDFCSESTTTQCWVFNYLGVADGAMHFYQKNHVRFCSYFVCVCCLICKPTVKARFERNAVTNLERYCFWIRWLYVFAVNVKSRFHMAVKRFAISYPIETIAEKMCLHNLLFNWTECSVREFW